MPAWYQVHVKHTVEADSLEEAVTKVMNGETDQQLPDNVEGENFDELDTYGMQAYNTPLDETDAEFVEFTEMLQNVKR